MENIILPIHLIALAYIAFNVVLADHMGFSWILGKKEKLEEIVIKKYHKRVWAGLIIMIISGVTLFLPLREFLLSRPQFYVKMGFVIALIINSFAIGHLSKISTEKSFSSLSKTEKAKFIISGAVSTICWLGAIAGGFYLIPE